MSTSRNPASAATAAELAAIPVFARLPSEALEDCAARSLRREVAKGETIFNQGDRPARFHVLLSGWVRIMQAGADGELSLIRFAGEGELFGAFAIFANSGYPADATAAMHAVEASWSEADVRQLIENHPSVSHNLLHVAARRLAELQDRVRELSTQPAEQRIANVLLRLAGPNREIACPLTRKDVAALAGTTLHTASRVLSGWARQGIVESAKQRIAIASRATLKAIAGES